MQSRLRSPCSATHPRRFRLAGRAEFLNDGDLRGSNTPATIEASNRAGPTPPSSGLGHREQGNRDNENQYAKVRPISPMRRQGARRCDDVDVPPPDWNVYAEWPNGCTGQKCERAIELGFRSVALNGHVDFTPPTISGDFSGVPPGGRRATLSSQLRTSGREQ